MKVYNPHFDGNLHPELIELVTQVRKERNFDPHLYIQAKAKVLNSYMQQFGLTACVVGVSGGIDSAIVLGLIKEAQNQPNSPIKKIVAELIPIFKSEGLTNQKEATQRGEELCEHFKITPTIIDLSSPQKSIKDEIQGEIKIEGKPWAVGQLGPYLRTPTLYYTTSLLAQEGFPAVVCGTTNKDEGAYLGYFGKASDGMVDVQLISDLHKSEVYHVASALKIPESIIKIKPNGDMYDGRVDEDLFGAPYIFVELYLNYLNLNEEEKREWIHSLGPKAQEQFKLLASNLEKLHSYNFHKYIGKSPAVHLDIYDGAVKGGWNNNISAHEEKVNRESFVNAYDLKEELIHFYKQNNGSPKIVECGLNMNQGFKVEKLLTSQECKITKDELEKQKWIPVGQNGMKNGFIKEHDKIGSYRLSFYNENFAKLLWKRISPLVQSIKIADDKTPTDIDGSKVWRAVGISPLFRCIKYEPGGLLVPHYDAPYIYSKNKRTLMSMVIYIDNDTIGGETRIILDHQQNLLPKEKDYADWSRLAKDDEVLFDIKGQPGSALIFDHRILHDSKEIKKGNKIIIRTDLVFERCDIKYKDEKLLWDYLSLTPELNVEQANLAYANIINPDKQTRLAWKVLRDPYYSELYKRFQNMDILKDAGFFEDELELEDTLKDTTDLLTTPIGKILKNLENSKSKENFVLLTTGAFFPLHEGHISMMQSAKDELEKEGHTVIGGYISPSHDLYLRKKHGKEYSISAANRVLNAQVAVQKSDWIMVDPWEAIYNKKDINFTDVIIRLEAYLNKHLGKKINLVYVCGGDNAGFMRAFIKKGYGVCVSRSIQDPKYKDFKATLSNTRIFFVENKRDTSHLSSTLIRKSSQNQNENNENKKGIYIIRDEGKDVLQNLKCNPSRLEYAHNNFVNGLFKELREFIPPNIECNIVDLKKQIIEAEKKLIGKDTLSLDPFFKGKYSLKISRLFQTSDLQQRPEKMIARPGSKKLEIQIKNIPQGTYTLVDDDSVSGETIKRVVDLLSPRIKIKDSYMLAKSSHAKIYDAVDVRDFIIGASEGGLVVQLGKGVVARAPYLLPYVSLHTRAKIPVEKELSLAYRIWKLNKIFFEEIKQPIPLKNTSKSFQILMQEVGFNNETNLKDICDWHINMLKDLVENESRL